MFIISHRVSSFENADIILVIQNGKITQSGTHEELMAQTDGYYRQVKEYLEKGDGEQNKKETQEFISSTLTLVSFLTACIVVLGIFIAPWITPIFCKKPAQEITQLLPNFPSFIPLFGKVNLNIEQNEYLQQVQYWMQQKNEITVLTRIMFPYLFLISIAAFFQGVLNGCNIFAPSGFTPVLFNSIVIIATYILSPHTSNPARAMAIGVVTGGSIQAVFQWPFVN